MFGSDQTWMRPPKEKKKKNLKIWLRTCLMILRSIPHHVTQHYVFFFLGDKRFFTEGLETTKSGGNAAAEEFQ